MKTADNETTVHNNATGSARDNMIGRWGCNANLVRFPPPTFPVILPETPPRQIITKSARRNVRATSLGAWRSRFKRHSQGRGRGTVVVNRILKEHQVRRQLHGPVRQVSFHIDWLLDLKPISVHLGHLILVGVHSM